MYQSVATPKLRESISKVQIYTSTYFISEWVCRITRIKYTLNEFIQFAATTLNKIMRIIVIPKCIVRI